MEYKLKHSNKLNMEGPLQNEVTFYQDVNVTVTQSRYVTNSKTYAMRNISSVHIFEIIKNRTLPIIMVIIGFLMLFSESSRILGFILFALGILILVLTKNEFTVRISTNAGEVNSIVSKDRLYVQNIVNALNDAIVYRG
ncbi:hypothetical protein GCM10007422_34110 [Pedobacter zeae]|uniref:QacE n=2 Tax=Pedobacter zeae TaxID=1737356 RepID=A0ABQ1Y6M9_9SPHI|nr:hypothetical protein GCM10007422_34110 [Pedobacter zeae]